MRASPSMSRLARLERRAVWPALSPPPTVRSLNWLMMLFAGWPIMVSMVSLRVLLERLGERRQLVHSPPVVLPTRHAVVVVIADLAFEVRMRFVDVDHGAPSLPSKRRRCDAVPRLAKRRPPGPAPGPSPKSARSRRGSPRPAACRR